MKLLDELPSAAIAILVTLTIIYDLSDYEY